MHAQRLLQPFPQCRRIFGQCVVQGSEKFRKLLLSPVQYIMCEQPSSRSQLQNPDPPRRAKRPPHLVKLPSQQAAKNRMDMAGGIEVSRLANLPSMTRGIALFR